MLSTRTLKKNHKVVVPACIKRESNIYGYPIQTFGYDNDMYNIGI